MGDPGRRLAGYWAVVLWRAFAYLHGLASPHIPRNGDEYPYTHITRLTAASGRSCPCAPSSRACATPSPRSSSGRASSPPIVGGPSACGTCALPSVVYTFLTGLLVLLLGRRLGGDDGTGLAAALASSRSSATSGTAVRT